MLSRAAGVDTASNTLIAGALMTKLLKMSAIVPISSPAAFAGRLEFLQYHIDVARPSIPCGSVNAKARQSSSGRGLLAPRHIA
jgi:hypothetical protein